MAMLNLVPPLFASGEYLDNVYYVILYMLLSVLGVALPFMVELPKYLSAVSNVLSGWFVSALSFEIINFDTPEIVLNSESSTEVFTRFALCFMVSVTFIMIHFTWKKNT